MGEYVATVREGTVPGEPDSAGGAPADDTMMRPTQDVRQPLEQSHGRKR